MGLFQSVLGMVAILLVGYLLSSSRRKVSWRAVGGAFAIQFTLGGLVLYLPAGQAALAWVAAGVSRVLNYARDGSAFVFGDFASDNYGFVFALRVLPAIVFFASLIGVLYHLGIMERVVRVIGGGIRLALGTSRAESMSAATNIFIGQSETPIAIRPFLAKMSSSELFAVMVCGMATVSGSVMGGYAAAGVELRYLIAASFMAAPAGLMMAKLIKPHDGPSSDEADVHEELMADRSANVIDAAATSALQGMHLALAIGALLLAFIGLIALLNGIIGGIGGIFGYGDITLQEMLAVVFQPVAYLIGVPWEEAGQVGSLLGQKLVLNEFIAFIDLINNHQNLSARSQAIATFALCGFACLTSIAIMVGGISVLVPERRAEASRLGLLAVAAATLANLMSATIAGFMLGLAEL